MFVFILGPDIKTIGSLVVALCDLVHMETIHGLCIFTAKSICVCC